MDADVSYIADFNIFDSGVCFLRNDGRIFASGCIDNQINRFNLSIAPVAQFILVVH